MQHIQINPRGQSSQTSQQILPDFKVPQVHTRVYYVETH